MANHKSLDALARAIEQLQRSPGQPADDYRAGFNQGIRCAADNYRSPADNTEFESGVRHAAAMVRAVAASPPAPARDPWVPVAEAPEEWQDGRELLMWNGRERWVDRWQYNGPGDQGYPISATHLMLIPDPPKGDNP